MEWVNMLCNILFAFSTFLCFHLPLNNPVVITRPLIKQDFDLLTVLRGQ